MGTNIDLSSCLLYTRGRTVREEPRQGCEPHPTAAFCKYTAEQLRMREAAGEVCENNWFKPSQLLEAIQERRFLAIELFTPESIFTFYRD